MWRLAEHQHVPGLLMYVSNFSFERFNLNLFYGQCLDKLNICVCRRFTFRQFERDSNLLQSSCSRSGSGGFLALGQGDGLAGLHAPRMACRWVWQRSTAAARGTRLENCSRNNVGQLCFWGLWVKSKGCAMWVFLGSRSS